jgi:nitrogen fixation/metabolism regulation signal transduction histidine kinase
MKPLQSQTPDSDSLQVLGRASVQIVHDLKNQLNGLKLYATFLRRRLDKSDRPDDELETVNKLIAGLDRAASDLSVLVQYGRPVELKKQQGVDLQKILRSVAAGSNDTSQAETLSIEPTNVKFTGEFDSVALAEALKSISKGALKFRNNKEIAEAVNVRLTEDNSNGQPSVVIEWQGLDKLDHDPFRSFAGSDEIRISFAGKIVEAHGGSTEYDNGVLRIRLPADATTTE